MINLFLIFWIIQLDTLNIDINEIEIIRGERRGKTVSRILFRFEIPQILYNSKIYHVQITFPNFLDTNDKKVEIEGFRITTPWTTNTVNWFYPWKNPGGDFDSSCYTTYIIEYGQKKKVFLDLTKFLKYWIRFGANYGIILKRPYYESDGFGGEVNNLINALRKAKIKVYYKLLFKKDEEKTLIFFVPEQFSSVQEAINRAPDGATISILSPVFYQPEEIHFYGKKLKIINRKEFSQICTIDLNKIIQENSKTLKRNTPSHRGGWEIPEIISDNADPDTTYDEQLNIASDENNNPWVIWVVVRNSRDDRIAVRRKNNARWSNIIYLKISTENAQLRPTVACGNSEKNLAVWHVTTWTNERFLEYSFYDGVMWSPPTRVTNSKELEFCPKIAFGGGKFWLVWYGNVIANYYKVYCSEWTGRSWKEPFCVSHETLGLHHWFCDIAVDNFGKPHIVWSEPFTGSVYYRTTDERGNWLAPIRLNNPDSIKCFCWGTTTIAVDNENRVYAAWIGVKRREDWPDIYFQYQKIPNGDFTSPTKIIGTEDWDELSQIIASSPSDVWIIWKRNIRGDPDSIFACHFNGNRWSENFLLNDVDPEYYYWYSSGCKGKKKIYVVFTKIHRSSRFLGTNILFTCYNYLDKLLKEGKK